MKNCYDIDLDEKILDAIKNSQEGKATFNKLVETLETTTPRTLIKHLHFLVKQEIIIWERNRGAGRKGNMELTDKTKIQRKYHILEFDYSDKKGLCKEKKIEIEKNEKKKRRRKLFLFLLLAVASGYTGYKITSKPQIGDIMIRDSIGRSIAVSTSSKKGFSPDDLIRKDFQLSPIHNYFNYNRFTKQDIEEIIEEIENNQDIQLGKIMERESDIRYDLKDNDLKDFILSCYDILSNFLYLIEQYWFILSKKPKPEETKWYYFIVGDTHAIKFFQKIEENRAKKKTVKDLYIESNFRNHNTELKDITIIEIEKINPKIFSRKGMEKNILFNSNSILLLKEQCKYINSNKKFLKLIQEKKYEFITDELVNLVNPPFSKKIYNIIST